MSPVEKACLVGTPQLLIFAALNRDCLWIVAPGLVVSVVYVAIGFYAFYCRRRDERRRGQAEADYYVMCATPKYPSRGFLWSGPHRSEKEVADEIADSQRFVGRRDVLYSIKSDRPKA